MRHRTGGVGRRAGAALPLARVRAANPQHAVAAHARHADARNPGRVQFALDEQRGVVPNERGRITDDGSVVAGMYAAGWIKRGPSGVIGTTKPDSVESAQLLLEDAPSLEACAEPDSAAGTELLKARDVRVGSYADWQRIDAAEVERGAAVGKPREKFTTVEEMLALL